MASSAITFNFDANASNNAGLGYDSSANGMGTADTIVVVGSATPQAASTVNLVVAGAPTSLTGSVALVYTGVNLAAPTPGAQIVASTNYSFGAGNPSGGRTVYYLVDDGSGGVYLQWAPNLSAAALGGFGGAVGAGAGGANAGGAQGTAIAGASAAASGNGGVGLRTLSNLTATGFHSAVG